MLQKTRPVQRSIESIVPDAKSIVQTASREFTLPAESRRSAIRPFGPRRAPCGDKRAESR